MRPWRLTSGPCEGRDGDLRGSDSGIRGTGANWSRDGRAAFGAALLAAAQVVAASGAEALVDAVDAAEFTR